ncbi:hypothetical protein K4749_10090 [Streptomyces sp. TRM72054]|uniref:hypothetical protein n=1 Tax=Streptomyces sp. TRM72054 TaxID=2870562 RepID=UPI001C8CEC0E|nr:hypothetical protein [Streptomyces sp. TRM72054]MBX9393930.1 hypothetical protein [Streptomyces sp. TRM72054]
MQESHRQLRAIESDMASSGAWVFSGRLIIEADDLDAALAWAAKVTAAINTPIEVRPFAAFADEPDPGLGA